ncbi:CLUMA_CG010171, isoform A [Clunio marinus]|uniref:CLUMA_CG010171, isoform A n=1 Tax=Clunio marinus TaxID=568069 RepID=A0A1J1IA59_9DIPT|nr:CLUMA_CG010171, isoform A [Clunio marinus]
MSHFYAACGMKTLHKIKKISVVKLTALCDKQKLIHVGCLNVPLLWTEEKKQMLWPIYRQELGINKCNLYFGELNAMLML